MFLRIHGLGVNSNLGEKIVKQSQEPRIIRAQRLLQKIVRYQESTLARISDRAAIYRPCKTGPTIANSSRLRIEAGRQRRPKRKRRLLLHGLQTFIQETPLLDFLQDRRLPYRPCTCPRKHPEPGVGVDDLFQPQHLFQRVHLDTALGDVFEEDVEASPEDVLEDREVLVRRR